MQEVKVNNTTFFVNPSTDGYHECWKETASGKWEPESFIILDRFLNSQKTFIDIGAWIGPLTLYAADKAKTVYAIEPDETAFAELTQNIACNNNIKNKIIPIQECISDKNDIVQFGNSKQWGNSGSSLLQGSGFNLDSNCDKNGNWKVSASVKSTTLEEFIKTHNINDCNFIKIDTEGAEVMILPNIYNYISKHKPILYLSIHTPFFQNINEDLKNIITTLSLYDNIYDAFLNKINISDLYSRRGFYSIVCA